MTWKIVKDQPKDRIYELIPMFLGERNTETSFLSILNSQSGTLSFDWRIIIERDLANESINFDK